MKTEKNFLIILLSLALSACHSGPKHNLDMKIPANIEKVSVQSFYINEKEVTSDYTEYKIEQKEPEIIIKNKADYSDKFIKSLKALNFKKFELKDSLLVIDGKDTAYFPTIPKIGKYIKLTGKREHVLMAVTVKRINYTTVDYTVEMVEFGKAHHNQSGQADIIASFFLGPEYDTNERTGAGYPVTEFSDYKTKDCHTYIRLGYEAGYPELLGKLIKNCNGKMKAITLDNFSTLIEK
jgi:hypothetical protein